MRAENFDLLIVKIEQWKMASDFSLKQKAKWDYLVGHFCKKLQNIPWILRPDGTTHWNWTNVTQSQCLRIIKWKIFHYVTSYMRQYFMDPEVLFRTKWYLLDHIINVLSIRYTNTTPTFVSPSVWPVFLRSFCSAIHY